MIRKRLKKVKKASERLPELVADKAASLNPLGTKDEPVNLADVPQITNENIGEHRESVLSGARKYIYPLAHSKHRIVQITSVIILFTALAFFSYCILALYRYYQYNTFVYRITQVVPFPIARENGHFVNYESYLFELRHYVHYYENHQQRNFGGADKEQLMTYRKQALETVIANAYVKDLAKKNGVKVSDKEVETQIAVVRHQNRLGANDKVFEDVLRDYWGWSISDFKRSLKDQLLAKKVSAKLDTTANTRAQSILTTLKAGGDFGEIAKANSDAPDKATGGDYGAPITKTNPNIPPEVIDQMFKMKAGEVSGVVVASRTDVSRPNTLEIIKVNSNDGTAVVAKHISVNLTDVSTYIKDLKAKQPAKNYVHF